jgi:nitrite reductase (NO-forming)
VYLEGSLTSPPAENIKVAVSPAGGAVMAEFKVKAPGTYTFVDPVKDRKDKGALGVLKVD